MNERDALKAAVMASVVGGIVANPNLTDGEIFWDQIIQDADKVAEQILEEAISY